MAVPKVNLRKVTRKKGISYMLDYAVDGKRFREAVGTNKRDAELLQAKIQSDLTLGKFQIPNQKATTISLKNVIDEYIAFKTHDVHPNSLKRYKNFLSPFREFFEENFPAAAENIKLIKETYVKAFINFLQDDKKDKEGKEWAKKTVNGMIVTAKQLFGYAIKHGYLEISPFEEVNRYKLITMGKVEYFEEAELELIWTKLDPYWVDPLKFIANTGLRKGELINLKWKNVNLELQEPQIVVTSDEHWQTKSGRMRAIPLNKPALEIIMRAKGNDKDYVFVSKTGLKIHPDQPLRVMKKALTDCNLKGDVHKLRHTFASHLVMKGVDLYTVSKLLGHSDIKMTQIYAHLSPGHLKDSVTKIEVS